MVGGREQGHTIIWLVKPLVGMEQGMEVKGSGVHSVLLLNYSLTCDDYKA